MNYELITIRNDLDKINDKITDLIKDKPLNQKEIHEKIQKLRNEIAEYIKVNKLNEFNNYGVGINNKFVDLLILNDLIHEKNKTSGGV